MINITHQIGLELADICKGVENCENCKYYEYCVDEVVQETAA